MYLLQQCSAQSILSSSINTGQKLLNTARNIKKNRYLWQNLTHLFQLSDGTWLVKWGICVLYGVRRSCERISMLARDTEGASPNPAPGLQLPYLWSVPSTTGITASLQCTVHTSGQAGGGQATELFLLLLMIQDEEWVYKRQSAEIIYSQQHNNQIVQIQQHSSDSNPSEWIINNRTSVFTWQQSCRGDFKRSLQEDISRSQVGKSMTMKTIVHGQMCLFLIIRTSGDDNWDNLWL